MLLKEQLLFIHNISNEVAPYYSLTQHQYGCMPILISEKTLDEKIPAEFRDIVMETLKEAGEVGSEAYIKEDDEALRVLVEAGKAESMKQTWMPL